MNSVRCEAVMIYVRCEVAVIAVKCVCSKLLC